MSAEITDDLLKRWPLPSLAEYSDKDARGRVLVAAAGAEVAGATLLTAVAALRAGAGKLQVAAPSGFSASLALALPEARVVPAAESAKGELSVEAAAILTDMHQRSDATVIGPGMLDEAAAGELALRLAEAGGRAMVIDAAALPGLAASPERARANGGRLVLTPHAGEMARLSGLSKEDILADPMAAARTAATRLHAVVVLKGAETLIVTPDGQSWRYASGSVGLGTSGSGDVLAGVICGLLARGAAPAQAAAWGVFIHGESGRRLAARIGRVGFLARELLDEVAPVLNGLETG